MSNVISLTGKPVPAAGLPDQHMIEGLEILLGLAKAGQLQSFWGAGFLDNGHRLQFKGGHHDNDHEFLGSLRWLESEYIDLVTNPGGA